MNPIDLVLSKLPKARQVGPGKWSARCPAHDDRAPSLSIGVGAAERVLLNCHAGCSINEICCAIGVEERDLFTTQHGGVQAVLPRRSAPSSSTAIAGAVWGRALQRVRNDDRIEDDVAVYEYLQTRGLEESWEHGSYGILAGEMDLPPEVAEWPRRGYRLVAPLHDLCGQVVNVQARRVLPGNPKTLLPRGSRARGTVFASRTGVELLRAPSGVGKVVLGEGLTDFLALSIVAPVPVLSAPGTSFFESAIGPWVADQDLYLAADLDSAGTACIEPTARAAHRAGARSVSFINWPGGCQDACDALAELGTARLAEFLEGELLAGGGNNAVS